MRKIDINRDVLYDLYIKGDLTYSEVAKRLNTSQSTIFRFCKEFNIKKEVIRPKRDKSKVHIPKGKHIKIDKDELYDLYIVQNKSIDELTLLYGVSRCIIKHALSYNGIKKEKNKSSEVYKRVMMEKYGVEHYSKTDEFKQKLKETNLKHCGYESNFQDPKFKQAMVEYNLKNYGVKNISERKDIRQKAKNTMIERYGTDVITSLPEIKTRIRKTNEERYGVDWYSKSEECKEKVRQTNLKHCGETSNLKTKEFQTHARQTCIEKYGFDHAMKSEFIKKKVIMTKKQNKTSTVSFQENKVFDLLVERFQNVERQYRSEEYPFACDFYIPNMSLYIEYQGHFSHGSEPYDNTNPDHEDIIAKWKSKNKDSYNDAIYTWTVRDPLKRETARKNNLNWIEFFNMKQFMGWYNEN